jgi:hypothetical protein
MLGAVHSVAAADDEVVLLRFRDIVFSVIPGIPPAEWTGSAYVPLD